MKYYINFFFLLISTAIPCMSAEIDSVRFTSQCGQDKYVLEKFFTKNNISLTNGFFIEFGAFDGVNLSNTYALEQLGWKGICIEPVPSMFEKLEKNRSCICIQGCIANKEGSALFREVNGTFEVLSGLEENYDPSHINLIDNVYQKPSKFYQVKCYTLSQILRDYNVEKVDFLSMDIEGGELKVLKSLSDDELNKVDVICVEDNYRDPEFINFLESKNFQFICRLEFDLIFRNKKYLEGDTGIRSITSYLQCAYNRFSEQFTGYLKKMYKAVYTLV